MPSSRPSPPSSKTLLRNYRSALRTIRKLPKPVSRNARDDLDKWLISSLAATSSAGKHPLAPAASGARTVKNPDPAGTSTDRVDYLASIWDAATATSPRAAGTIATPVSAPPPSTPSALSTASRHQRQDSYEPLSREEHHDAHQRHYTDDCKGCAYNSTLSYRHDRVCPRRYIPNHDPWQA